MGNDAQARSDAERAASPIEQTGGILDLQVYALLEQIYRRLGEEELADKYANLTRQTPPQRAKDLIRHHRNKSTGVSPLSAPSAGVRPDEARRLQFRDIAIVEDGGERQDDP